MKKILISILALAAAAPLFAQNLNPEVEVTNDYEARMADVHKNGVFMSVPDSLTQFSTAIDYSVFDTQYKGAYEFSPYPIEIAPEAAPFTGNKLYLRGGFSTRLTSVGRLVYTPFQRGLVRNTNYVDWDGYGNYFSSLDNRGDYSGHDNSLGAGSIIRWNKEHFDFEGKLAYNGIFTKDNETRSGFNKVSLGGLVHSNQDDAPLPYRLGVSMHFAQDKLSAMSGLSEFGFHIGGSITPYSEGDLAAVLDIDTQGAAYSGIFSNSMLSNIAPKAVFQWGSLKLSAGLRMSISEYFSIHPDFRADFVPESGVIGLYAQITGGQSAVSYSSSKMGDHWFNPGYLTSFKTANEKIGASMGVRGSLFKHFQYDLSGGYGILSNQFMDRVEVLSDGRYAVGADYAAFNAYWVRALLEYASKSFDFDADIHYRHAAFGLSDVLLSIPAWCIETSAVYNWNRRIYAGIRCKASTARSTTAVKLPGFVDLGIYAEYEFPRLFSIWAQAGNLIGGDVVYSPTHIRPGRDFTFGITLKIK